MTQERFLRGSEERGVGFPITKGREGFWPRRNQKALRQTSIMMILGTIPGERLMLPEFGSRLPLLIFEPNDVILVQQLRAETAQAIQRWDPSLVVVGVAPEIDDNTVRIYIDYYDKRDLSQELRRTTFNLKRQ